MILEPISPGLGEEPHLQLVAHGCSSEPSGALSVDLWLWDLDGEWEKEESSSLLSRDERARGARFREGVLRRRFVQSRCLLRRILARHLAVSPEGLAFRYTEEGKPFLGAEHGLEFSLSHSGSLLLLGVAREAVGVDIEGVRPMPDLEAVARLVFTPEEMAFLEEDPPGGRLEAFFRLWAGKEALLKGLGVGFLSDPMEVDLRPTPFGFRATPPGSDAAPPGSGATPPGSPGAEWSMASFPVESESGEGLAFAAVALPVRAETFRVSALLGPDRESYGEARGGGAGVSQEGVSGTGGTSGGNSRHTL